jgi:hypothetical protein
MKKATVKALICLVILIIGGDLILGCGGGAKETAVATPKTTTPTMSHFAESGIAFDYNSKWKVLKSDDPTRLVYLMGTDTSTTIQVIKNETGGFELKTYHDNLAIALMTGEPISGNPLTVAGASAYETVFTYKKDNAEFRMRLISLEKGDYFYNMVFSTDPASYDKLDKDFSTVVDSFTVE